MTIIAVLLWGATSAFRQWRQHHVVGLALERLATPSAVKDSDLRALVDHLSATHCKSLDLSNANISVDGLLVLVQLQELEELVLDGTAIADEQLVVLEAFPNLRTVSMKNTPVSWKAAVHLSITCPDVSILIRPDRISACAKNGGVRILSEEIAVHQSPIPDWANGLAGLEEADELRSLDLSGGWLLMVQHLAPLQELKQLEVLDLAGTHVGDRAIDTLLQMKQLTDLRFPHWISAKGEDRLRRGLPECRFLRAKRFEYEY